MIFIQTEAGVIQGIENVALEYFFMLICIRYITLLNVLINKFTTGEKVPMTLVVLKMAIQFREKKVTYTIFKWKFTYSTDEPHVIKNTSLQRNQSSDIYFIENIPKTTKNASHVL